MSSGSPAEVTLLHVIKHDDINLPLLIYLGCRAETINRSQITRLKIASNPFAKGFRDIPASKRLVALEQICTSRDYCLESRKTILASYLIFLFVPNHCSTRDNSEFLLIRDKRFDLPANLSSFDLIRP